MSEERVLPSEMTAETAPSRSPLAIARDVAFLVAIYAYFTGYTYYYFWMQGFGIYASVTDEQPYHIFVYSFQVFSRYWGWLVLYILGALLLWYVLGLAVRFHRLDRVKGAIPILRIVVIAAAVIGLFKFLYGWSQDSADDFVTGIRDGTFDAPTVKVMLKPEYKRYFDQGFYIDNEQFCLTLVAETKDMIYLLSQDLAEDHGKPVGTPNGCTNTPPTRGTLPAGYVYAIPRSSIVSVIMQQDAIDLSK